MVQKKINKRFSSNKNKKNNVTKHKQKRQNKSKKNKIQILPTIFKQEIITNKPVPIIVYGKIYANWCGHCQAMESFWKNVQTKMMPVKSKDIEQTNQENEIVIFNNEYELLGNNKLALQGGYPTIYKLNKKKGIIEYYNGERTEYDILLWLNKPNDEVVVNTNNIDNRINNPINVNNNDIVSELNPNR